MCALAYISLIPIHTHSKHPTTPLRARMVYRKRSFVRERHGVSASAKFGCRLQTQPHQPTCRLAPTLVASMAPERTPEDGSASSRSEDTHIEPPPTAKAVYGVGGGCAVNWFSILGGSRYHFGRRCGETTAPSTDQFGNTAAQHRLAGPYPSDPTGEDTSSTARAWR